MYYYIKGRLAHKEDNFVVIDAGGVGYQLYMSLNSIAKIGDIGSDVTVWTYLHIKEGVMDLYGFYTVEEKEMFLQLLSISGIGTKSALSILSVAPPEKLALAIITNDYKTIQKAQGVGQKAAQRVVLELADKLKNADLAIENLTEIDTTDNRSEALSALVVLGYSDKEAKQALKTIEPNLATEDIIKLALKKMM